MQIVHNRESLLDQIKEYKFRGKKITLIPTMGNLHQGHQALFSKAPANSIKIATIYVNPLQFNNNDDFHNYPRSMQSDLEVCRQNNISLVYVPYGDISNEIDIEKNIDLPKFTRYLCGQTREDHFHGVYKIVKHLFNIVNPDFACFGKKDYQQLLLIKYIARTYFPDLEITEVDTVRSNNIALSSRLNRLSNKSLQNTKVIYETLKNIRQDLIDGNDFKCIQKKFIKKIENNNIIVEYLEHRKSDTLELADGHLNNSSVFIACIIDNIRLIDNLQI